MYIFPKKCERKYLHRHLATLTLSIRITKAFYTLESDAVTFHNYFPHTLIGTVCLPNLTYLSYSLTMCVDIIAVNVITSSIPTNVLMHN